MGTHRLRSDHPKSCRSRSRSGGGCGGGGSGLLVELFQPPAGFQNVLAVAEGADSDESLAAGSEPAAGGGHQVGLLKNLSKHVPRAPAREVHPHIWRVLPAVHVEAQGAEGVDDNLGVLLVEADHTVHRLKQERKSQRKK